MRCPTGPMFLITIPLVALAACGDQTAGPFDAATIAIAGYDCLETGLNADSIGVADVLAHNTADHEVAGDYAWDPADAVPITLNGATITVGGSGATVSGTTVTITAAGTYVISGTLDSGQIVVSTKGQVVRLVLNGMTITHPGDAPVLVSKATRVVVILAPGTTNRVTDGPSYPAGVDQNAAFFSKTNLSIGGTGTLIVTGRFEDGLTSKDGLVIADGHITVTAADDGIRGKDYLVVRGGTIDVTSGGDGLKSDEDADTTLGYVLIEDGAITVDAGGDAVAAETDALISGGTLTLRAGGGHAAIIDTSLSAKGVKGLAYVVIDSGNVTIDAADDGLHSNAHVVVNGGTIRIATGDDGVHSDSTLVVNGGDLTVTASYEGIESKEGDMTLNGGRIHVTSSDDGVNVAGAGDAGRPGPGLSSNLYHLYFNGGYVVSTSGGDGVDVNGSVVMTGGCLVIHGPTVNFDGAIDYDGTFTITGGFIAAAGSSGMAQGPGATSPQHSVLTTFAAPRPAGTLMHVRSATGEDVLDFTPSKAFQSLVFSSPRLAAGASYAAYFGGSVDSAATDGLYTGGTYTPGTVEAVFTIAGALTKVIP